MGPDGEELSAICETIDRLISTQIEARPEEPPGTILKLYEAARDQSGKPLVQAAAEGLLEATAGGRPVVVSTGWVIDLWYPRGELCGMVGAVALCRALSQGMGLPVCFVGEEAVLPVFEAAARAVGMRLYPYDKMADIPQAIVARGFPVESAQAQAEAVRVLEEVRPRAIVTIEKCAPNTKGIYHTGRGSDMSASTAKVDLLVREARSRGVLTIGIGDLGNEIGFGKIRSAVEQYLPRGRQCGCPCGGGIASDVETDRLIVASSSNRGAYGLVAALGTLLRNASLVPTGAEDTRMIQAAAYAGACDSFTAQPTLTDGHGVPAEYHACFVELLRYQVQRQGITYPLFGARA